MNIINVRNVNEALPLALDLLNKIGVQEPSRNGPVLVMPGPVATVYSNPMERVLFNPVRDANPVFHLMEAIWMLAGENNVEWLLQFNSKFGQYAEDGVMHGAYGHRWRRHFGHDQLQLAIEELRDSPASRRVVMGMWDPTHDQRASFADVPCNTHLYLDCRDGKVNMTVCCRSNDVLWGAYGSNVVHFSMLQELVAAGLELPVGEYVQFSNNFHVYTELALAKELLENPPQHDYDFYRTGLCKPMPMVDGDTGETWQDFVDDCEKLVHGLGDTYATRFFKQVVRPLFLSYVRRKAAQKYDFFLNALPHDNDWALAFNDWITRRT